MFKSALPHPQTNRALRCLLATFVLLAGPAQAEIFYKWKSTDGVWEYGAHPPPGIQAIEIKTTSTKAIPTNVDNGTSTANELANAPKTEAEVKAKRAKSKKNAEYCKTAHANRDALSSKAVIRRRDAEGNITTVSDQERKEEMEKAEVAIERYCR